MASFLIHMCICDEVNKIIKRDRKKILIGSIAPDIAKLVGIDRNITHFGEYPCFDINLFLSKYKKHFDDDFVLGYFIHLYTDYLWDKYFIKKIYEDGILTMIDGNKIKFDGDISSYLYKDYDSLIDDLINTYNIDLSFFNGDMPKIPNIIDEIPMDKLYIVVKKANKLMKESIKNKLCVMDINSVNEFIEFSKFKIINKIDKIV